MTEFIARHIESVGQLEVLLCLSRQPERCWSVDELTREIRGQSDPVQRWTSALAASKLCLLQPTGYRYQPANDDIDKVVSSLAMCYQMSPLRIVEAIYAKPKSDVMEFARAFKLRGKP